MVKIKEDLRSLRTKTHLSNALLDLINENKHHFESITVKMICDKAMVHRTTFYKHFEDKYHLLVYSVDPMQKGFDCFTPKERICTPFKCMLHTWDKQLTLTVFECLYLTEHFRNDFARRMKNLMLADLSELLDNEYENPVPNEIIAEIFGNSIFGLAQWWIRNEKAISADKMDEYFQTIVNTSIFD